MTQATNPQGTGAAACDGGQCGAGGYCAECPAAAASSRRAPHALDRAEWVARFTERLRRKLDLTGPELEHVAPAELESWPEAPGRFDSDWRDETPEDAADENLSYWTD